MFYPTPVRAIYVYAVILVSLFIMGFLWVIFNAVVVPLQAGISTAMSPYNVANTSYQNYVLADTFMTNLWTYILVLFVLGLLLWVYHYSQRERAGVLSQ